MANEERGMNISYSIHISKGKEGEYPAQKVSVYADTIIELSNPVRITFRGHGETKAEASLEARKSIADAVDAFQSLANRIKLEEA